MAPIERIPVYIAILESRQLLVFRKNKSLGLLGGKPEGGEDELSALERFTQEGLPGTEFANPFFYREFKERTPDARFELKARVYVSDLNVLGRPPAQMKDRDDRFFFASYPSARHLSMITANVLKKLYEDRLICDSPKQF